MIRIIFFYIKLTVPCFLDLQDHAIRQHQKLNNWFVVQLIQV